MSPASATRHQQRVEELCGATVRALTGDRQLHARARRWYVGNRLLPVAAPHLYPAADADFTGFRGAADGLALRCLHSDAALHQALAPTTSAARVVFDVLEQLRVEALVASTWPGAQHNLRHRFEQWSSDFAASDLMETSSGVLMFALAQTARTRLTGEPVHAGSEDAIEGTRGELAQLAGHHLVALKAARHDQAQFAAHALALALQVAGMLQALRGSSADDVAVSEEAAALSAFTLHVDFGPDAEQALPVAGHGKSRVLEAAGERYRVFTTEFDVQQDAAQQARPEELRALRDALDVAITRSGLSVTRLARELQALLSQPQADDWDSGQEAGRIDGRRLAQLVASPAERRLFRTPHLELQSTCQVTLLIDCSGSMKQHMAWVALLADVLARALEQAGAGIEVLGYTTAAWHGGRAAKAWQRAGRTPHPGRLNEVRHLIFKDAQRPWRRARLGLAALQKADLFREGIDGEAVAWACARLRAAGDGDGDVDTQRRILIVLSDGSPMDSATHLANDAHYLDHHLRQVVDQEEAHGGIDILGLGVGLDLSPYYSRCQALDPTPPISHATLRDVMALMAGQRHR
jgi:cobaltochelatase CobT